MQIERVEEKILLRRDKEKEAISLATQGRWEEAVAVNRAILSMFPQDIEALNRLGKALSELGRYPESKRVFTQVLKLAPNNAIARKNLERLARLKQSPPAKPVGGLQSRLFVEEGGKTCVTKLQDVASSEVLASVAAGDPVALVPADNTLKIQGQGGVYLGRIQPKLSARLARLIRGGNRYIAAVASVTDKELSVIIREEYQHPALAGVVSFPAHTDHLAPYLEISEGELEELEAEALVEGQVEAEGEEVAAEASNSHTPKEDDEEEEGEEE
ncbi:MAG: tetratricopeptide repeat protein [Chloroflexi bacterium]|nr:tetratricopeptide repeat protein [Chloroflexota bacterium]